MKRNIDEEITGPLGNRYILINLGYSTDVFFRPSGINIPEEISSSWNNNDSFYKYVVHNFRQKRTVCITLKPSINSTPVNTSLAQNPYVVVKSYL